MNGTRCLDTKTVLKAGARFSKVKRTFQARKSIRKTTACLFCKVGLLICCKGNKNKNNCKVSWLETPSFWRYKENYVTRNTPEKFRDFRETGPSNFNYHIRTRAVKSVVLGVTFWKKFFFLSPGNSSIQLSWRHSNHHRSNCAVKTIVRDGRSQEILLLKKPQDNAVQWN